MLVSSSFLDKEGKEFFIKYDFTIPRAGEKYVNVTVMKTAEKGLKLEFELPREPIKNPIRFDLEYYPAWIEADVDIEIKY